MIGSIIQGLKVLHRDLTHDSRIKREEEKKKEEEREIERLFMKLSDRDRSKIRNLSEVRGVGMDIIARDYGVPDGVIYKVLNE